MNKRTLASGVFTAYVLTVVAANWVTQRYGFIPVGFGLTAAAGTYAAGAALMLRNVVQDLSGRLVVLAAILIGAGFSWELASPQLAVASGVTFLVAESADMLLYTPLRKRGWARAVLAGNLLGAVVDTFLFLSLAGFPVMKSAPGQLVGKFLWASVMPVVLISLGRWISGASARRAVKDGAQ